MNKSLNWFLWVVTLLLSYCHASYSILPKIIHWSYGFKSGQTSKFSQSKSKSRVRQWYLLLVKSFIIPLQPEETRNQSLAKIGPTAWFNFYNFPNSQSINRNSFIALNINKLATSIWKLSHLKLKCWVRRTFDIIGKGSVRLCTKIQFRPPVVKPSRNNSGQRFEWLNFFIPIVSEFETCT